MKLRSYQTMTDTAKLHQGLQERLRFIGVDTPETGSGIVAIQATQYTYNALKNAKTIYIQYDPHRAVRILMAASRTNMVRW